MTKNKLILKFVFSCIVASLICCGKSSENLDIQEAFISAACQGNLASVKNLAGKQADMDAAAGFEGHYWPPAIICASSHGRVEIVQFLLNNGADPNVRTVSGETALMAAANDGNIQIARLLIDKGADVNAQANNGSALSIADMRNHGEFAEFLRRAGAKH